MIDFAPIRREARPAPRAARNGLPHTVTSLSVVVPVYNSESSLPMLIERLEPVLNSLGMRYEVILVNDGSRDRSWETICELAAARPWLSGINLMRNFGQHNALLCGIRAATGDAVVTMDDDLQNPPEEIHKLLAQLDEGFDVVYGTPLKERHGLLRDLASQITKMTLQNAMGATIARQVSAFRAFRTELRAASDQYDGPFLSIDVLLTWGTTRFSAVPVQHDARLAGPSNYTMPKLVAHAFNMMTGFTVLPLQIGSLVGFGFTIFGFCVLAYVVARYLFQGAAVPGFAFLASLIAIFSGVQLFALGMIGEYLARMHFRMMSRPTYVVRGTTPKE
jgi:undecaprenyl-phosphate 4-deoxy-4-formamido-L-arabinose transferase